ncbi:hypothetical protein EJB05_24806, partial [Eragrostis curvula]
MALLPPRTPRLVALVWLAMALLLAATSGCLCRDVPLPFGGRGLLSTPASPGTPPPPSGFPRPICRLCPPRCPPEGCPPP